MASPKGRPPEAISRGPLRDPPSLMGHAAHTLPSAVRKEHEGKGSSPVVWILPCCKRLFYMAATFPLTFRALSVCLGAEN